MILRADLLEAEAALARTDPDAVDALTGRVVRSLLQEAAHGVPLSPKESLLIARTLSDTFAGIKPASVPLFVLMQLLGGALALGVVRLLHPPVPSPVEEPVRG